MTEKQVRLTSEQLDRLLVLAKRQVQLKQQKLHTAGCTQQEIADIGKRAAETTQPLKDGGTIELEGDHYRLAGHDSEGVTLRKLPNPNTR